MYERIKTRITQAKVSDSGDGVTISRLNWVIPRPNRRQHPVNLISVQRGIFRKVGDAIEHVVQAPNTENSEHAGDVFDEACNTKDTLGQ
jgi:hypothetical protein